MILKMSWESESLDEKVAVLRGIVQRQIKQILLQSTDKPDLWSKLGSLGLDDADVHAKMADIDRTNAYKWDGSVIDIENQGGLNPVTLYMYNTLYYGRTPVHLAISTLPLKKQHFVYKFFHSLLAYQLACEGLHKSSVAPYMLPTHR